MRYLALATDYDGTIARHGTVDDGVWEALRRLRESGRRVILATGRRLEELQAICPRLDAFDRVVAENGAVVFDPQTKESTVIGEPPPERFVADLRRRNVRPLDVGRVVAATEKPHDRDVLDAIRELGLELHVIFNRDSVMVLPPGVNKATGLNAALKQLGLSPHNAVAVGDSENDHALFAACECAVAVAGSVPALLDRADLVTRGGAGEGVVELVERLLKDDLADAAEGLHRHEILIGTTADGNPEYLPPYGENVLIAGTSGSGKSTMTTGLLERLAEAGYQYAVIDPEGDYSSALPGAVALGAPDRAPKVEEVIDLLAAGGKNVVVNLLGVPLADRPGFFDQLFPRLLELRSRTGRPHWVVIDEAHHLMPTAWKLDGEGVPRRLHGVAMITVHPASVSRAMLDAVDLLMAVGQGPGKTIDEFCDARRVGCPHFDAPDELESGEAVAWWVGSGCEPFAVKTEPPRTERRRHLRKYAEGRLADDRAFAFRGPDGKLNLKAHNLIAFVTMAAGVDDETWLYHLERGEYSRWFRDAIKDPGLADEVAAVEGDAGADPAETREAVRTAIEARYTLPTEPSGA